MLVFLAQTSPLLIEAKPHPDPVPPGFFLLSLIIIALLFWVYSLTQKLKANSSAKQRATENTYRNQIAGYVLNGSIWGLITLASFISFVPIFRVDPSDAKEIFNSILPVFGTWVGTLLAYYFSKENFEAATKSVSDAVRNAGSAEERLQSVLVKENWIPKQQMKIPDGLVGPLKDCKFPLSAIQEFADANPHIDRVPILAVDGTPCAVVHLSLIEKFLVRYYLQSPKPTGTQTLPKLDEATLQDIWMDKSFQAILQSSYGLVRETATLADAKSAMDSADGRLGTKGGVFDVFVTENGQANRPVLGWVTNTIIRQHTRI